MDGYASEAIGVAFAAGSLTIITAATSLDFTLEPTYSILNSSYLTSLKAAEDQMSVNSIDRYYPGYCGFHSLGSRCERCYPCDRDFSYYIDRLAIRRFVIGCFKKVKHLIGHDSCEKMVTLIDLLRRLLIIIFISLGTRIFSQFLIQSQ